jgi:hypothetical protein
LVDSFGIAASIIAGAILDTLPVGQDQIDDFESDQIDPNNYTYLLSIEDDDDEDDDEENGFCTLGKVSVC